MTDGDSVLDETGEAMTAKLETCRLTLMAPGLCCVCERPAAYAVLQEIPVGPAAGLIEHLRCVECTAAARQDPLYVAIKTYKPPVLPTVDTEQNKEQV